MPTGWGKSAIYQLAGTVLPGPTIVVSPLLALQRDQVLSLAASNASEAVAVNSDSSVGEDRDSWARLRQGAAEFLFVTPEQLTSSEVLQRLTDLRPSLLVVDEAHCVSAWGHDFRPDYLRIGDVLERVGRPRVLALTATAAPPVRAEIVERLGMQSVTEIVHGFDRPNLSLSVRLFSDQRAKQEAALAFVAEAARPGLLYVGRRKDTEWYAGRLRDSGLQAGAFHAGMRAREREKVHRRFLDGELDVVVATCAFGMGIDKPDVRFVLHADVSESLDAYYQEIGRAGRDGQPAQAMLLYRIEDLGLRKFFASGGFDEDTTRSAAAAVLGQPTGIPDLQRSLGVAARRVVKAVSLLEQAGVVRVDGSRTVSWAAAERSVEYAVAAAEGVADAIRKANQSRVEMMRGYAETTGCRRQFLLGYFGEQLGQPCGNCDRCADGIPEEALAGQADRDAAEPQRYPPNARVVHQSWGPGIVMTVEPDRMTVLFEQVGYKTLARELVEDNDLLRAPHEP